ncbi:hypothetical protein FB451DRAFT_1413814 [Mycena latifolia]|nr:hypothetical protein FB451DRAFT_1413814 [Mycena latifolia]
MASALLRASKVTPPPSFFLGVPHFLLDFQAPWTLKETRDVLKLCTNLVDFVAIDINSTIFPVLGDKRLCRLSCALEMFTSLICVYPIAALPDPHLVLNEMVAWDLVELILVQCPRLEVLIVTFHASVGGDSFVRDWAEQSPINDVRFVVAKYTIYANDWEATAKGLPTGGP